jgi:hypothetical protein
MKRLLSICAAIVILFSSYALAGTWTTIDVPADWGTLTAIQGISGSRIVGTYVTSNNPHSFVYDGGTFSKLDMPEATYTTASDIFGNSIVGTYGGAGSGSFLYDGTNWSTLSKSGASVRANGIYGNNIVGFYVNPSGPVHGFIYDGVNWTTVDKAEADSTSLSGISGNDIVGQYRDTAYRLHPFLYNQGSWTDLPINPWDSFATVVDISGNYIISGGWSIEGSFGVLYDGKSWTKLEMPGAISTDVRGIDGNKVVGSYSLSINEKHGFIYTIPEPCTLLLLGLGAAMAVKRNKISRLRL